MKHISTLLFPTMAKEILLYGGIYTYSVESFINKMEDYKNSDVVVRINSGGGDPISMWGAVAKMREHSKNVLVKVDGKADSAATYFMLYGDKVEALNVSTFVLHRAAYSNIDESKLTPDETAELAKVNIDMRKALEMKIDAAKLKEIKGVTLDEIFDLKQRIDVNLTAQQALDIGLIDKINPINEKEMRAIHEYMHAIAASTTEPQQTPTNPNKMDLLKLKADHPALYAEVFALGVAKEKDRVEACLVYNDLDPIGVKAAIESGKDLSAKQMAEFGLKAMSASGLAAIKKDAAGNIITAAVDGKEKTDDEKELSAFEKQVRVNAGLDKEKK